MGIFDSIKLALFGRNNKSGKVEKVEKVLRKGRLVSVKRVRVDELDRSMCSSGFLKRNFPGDMLVNIKCFDNGDLDLRGKDGEYRIIVEDKK